MKILYIANIRLPTEKAHGIQIMKMCEAFSRAGHTLSLVVPKRLNLIKEDPFEYYGVEKIFKVSKLITLDLVHLGSVGFWIQYISFAKVATLYALFQKVDIIYTRDELVTYFLGFFKKNIYWEVHTKKSSWIAKAAAKKAKKIVVISQGLKEYILKEYGLSEGKVIVAHDGVDLKEFEDKRSKEELREELRLPKEKKIIAYVGKYKTMGQTKGVNDLIQAFGDVYKEDKEAFLLLVGINKDEVDEVTNIFKTCSIPEEYWSIVLHVTHNKAILYMKAVDVLVMNYPNTEHYAKYMSPLKLFEYMASGNVIIASDLPSVREVLGDTNSVLINTDDETGLIKALGQVIKNTDSTNNLAKQAQIDIGKYTWTRRIDRVLTF